MIIAVPSVESKKTVELPWGVIRWDEVMEMPPDFSVSKSLKRDLKHDLFVLPYSRC